jgi:hypothetical protein
VRSHQHDYFSLFVHVSEISWYSTYTCGPYPPSSFLRIFIFFGAVLLSTRLFIHCKWRPSGLGIELQSSITMKLSSLLLSVGALLIAAVSAQDLTQLLGDLPQCAVSSFRSSHVSYYIETNKCFSC